MIFCSCYFAIALLLMNLLVLVNESKQYLQYKSFTTFTSEQNFDIYLLYLYVHVVIQPFSRRLKPVP